MAIAPSLQRRASPGELPGGIVKEGLNPNGPLLQFAAMIAATFAFAWLARFVIPLVLERRWVTVSYCAALAGAPVTLMHFGTLRHVVLHGVAAAAIVAARRLDPRFTRHDCVLLPALLSLYFAFLDIGFGKTPAATFLRAAIALFALRVVAGVVVRAAKPGLAFAAAPLALLAQLQWLSPVTSAVIAIVWIFASPFALAFVRERALVKFAAYAAYPLIVAAYPLALLGVTSAPYVDFFEDGHDVLPAAEMLRGETPYRDIIPMHGIVSDGALHVVAAKLGASSLGALLRTRLVIASADAAAIYFVALAVTGTADIALLAVFLALSLFPSEVVWLRAIPELAALACVAAGTRLRSRRWFLVSGALTAFSFLVSLDLAIYTMVVSGIAAIRARFVRPLMIGAGGVTFVSLLVFALFGFAGDYVRVTLGEVLSTGGIYMIGATDLPECLRSISALAMRIGDPECLALLVWVIALVGGATALGRSLRARRRDGVWYVALWIVLAAISFVERRHFYFVFAAAPFIAGTLLLLARRAREAAIVLTLLIVFLARPFAHIFDVATPLRRAHGLPAGDRLAAPLPRAGDALFDPGTARALGAMQRFLAGSLRRDETFFDFANAGLLYYLFDRDCPIRQVEVPLYESEAAQREVIATLERNRRVRAALIVFPSAYSSIDGVPNRERAPLVWRYLETHFTPAFDEEGVVFWLRNSR